jgi:hypothetical protein
MDCLYWINVEGAEQKEPNKNYVKPRDRDLESAADTTSDNKCSYEAEATDICFHCKG